MPFSSCGGPICPGNLLIYLIGSSGESSPLTTSTGPDGGSVADTGKFELVPHTADLGICVTSPTRAGLIKIATQGLYAVIGNLKAEDGSRFRRTLELTDGDALSYLRDYLAELLFLFYSKREIATMVRIKEFSDEQFLGEIEVARLDEQCSVFEREVKAITYHELAITEKKSDTGETFYEAMIIVDI